MKDPFTLISDYKRALAKLSTNIRELEQDIVSKKARIEELISKNIALQGEVLSAREAVAELEKLVSVKPKRKRSDTDTTSEDDNA